MLPDPVVVLLQIVMASSVGIVSYLFWRSIESKLPQLSTWLFCCGIVAELFFVCRIPGAWKGVETLVGTVACSAIGARLHALSGGKSSSYFHAFQLLFLSSVISFLFSGQVVFMYLPYRYIRAISTPASMTLLFFTLVSPAATALFWLVLRASRPRPGLETHLHPEDK